ncbi:hypothetical protein C8J56DRAFT_1052590 [Mycena floridula]|nr:hypothetical protein C8J56DRAFT_1052590 [Mycena floridula]
MEESVFIFNSDDSDSDATTEDETPEEPDAPPTRVQHFGKSKSAYHSRKHRQSVKDNTFVTDAAKLQRFTLKIKKLDPNAEIESAVSVRHLRCGKALQMKEPYNTYNFKKHHEGCKGPNKGRTGGGMPTLFTMFRPQSAKAGPSSRPTAVVDSDSDSESESDSKSDSDCDLPCTGLTKKDDARIGVYIKRTMAPGGGGPDVQKLAIILFQKPYHQLSAARKDAVHSAKRNENRWRNDHISESVFSKSCSGKCQKIKVPGQKTVILPCDHCQSVYRLRRFKNAISIPMPPLENYKFTNDRHTQKTLAHIYSYTIGIEKIMELDDPLKCLEVRFVAGLLSGDYKANQAGDLLKGLIQSYVIKKEKAERGIGMQAFRHSPDITEWAHIMHAFSPRAYKALSDIFPLPTARALRMQRAKQPSFPIGITPRTFTLAAAHLENLNYSGPVALSCDDTKLSPALRPFWDSDRQGFCMLGSTGEPLLVANPELPEQAIQQANIQKATKLRLWCLQVPMPSIPTIILAALGISASMDASELWHLLRKIIDGLIGLKIPLRSYACDGSSTERAVQALLDANATRTEVHTITHPRLGKNGRLRVTIPFYGDHPIANLQDSMHNGKTDRNNAMSGAHYPTFPNNIVLYSQLHLKDDSAAIRLLSGHTLEWLAKSYPEERGLIAYLFICGELLDVYQNRHISIIDRVQMVLRAHFFFEFWEKFLNHAKYPKHKHFLSKEAVAITARIIQGFLQLVFIYRDHLPGKYPLLPWLLLTEICEHIFGMSRQTITDFTLEDFYQMLPKLFVCQREAVFAAKFSNGKERASGYNHTYMDNKDINLVNLATFPTDSEIDAASVHAYGEAENLFAWLGLSVDDLYSDESGSQETALPSVRTWYAAPNEKETDSDSNDKEPDSDSDDSGSSSDSESDSESESEVSTSKILQVVESLEGYDPILDKDEHEIMALRYTAAAIKAKETIWISAMAEFDDDKRSEALTDEAQIIAKALADTLSPVNVGTQASDTSYLHTASLDELVRLHMSHHSRQAETGIRGPKKSKTAKISIGAESEATLAKRQRSELYRKLLDIARRENAETRGISTGAHRDKRWKEPEPRVPAPGGQDAVVGGALPSVAPAGNSANAAVSATAVAAKNLKKRTTVFKSVKLPLILGSARVSALSPLMVSETSSGGFGIVFHEDKLVVCKILAIFSKTGGKNGHHSWVSDSSSIAAVSYLAAQIYNHLAAAQFRGISPPFYCKRFARLDPHSFLVALAQAPQTTQDGGLILAGEDRDLFRALQLEKQSIVKALKTLRGRKARGMAKNPANESENDSD